MYRRRSRRQSIVILEQVPRGCTSYKERRTNGLVLVLGPGCLPAYRAGVRVGSQQKIKIFGFLPPLPAPSSVYNKGWGGTPSGFT